MYSRLQIALKYLNYWIRASNGKGHGMHSPFVFEFIRDVLNDHTHYEEYEKVEALRNKLLKDQRVLDINDPGAGSSSNNSGKRSVAQIARSAAKQKKIAQLLFRIARKYSPHNILELGTSLGISAAYFSLANPTADITTIEGVPSIAAIARENLQSLEIKNCRVETGNFDELLLPVLDTMPAVDLAFIDGNHRLGPTTTYFNQLFKKTHNDTILIFDDIHWSREMEQAWARIRTHEKVRCSIDLYFIGLIFFRQEFMENQDFVIRF
jgi:predicted O-methyltransferase YrrM